MKAVFDTNILVDYLNGFPQAAEELNRYSQRLISQITWMEVLQGAGTTGKSNWYANSLPLLMWSPSIPR
jgi:predicted nucleic acid-binding protein